MLELHENSVHKSAWELEHELLQFGEEEGSRGDVTDAPLALSVFVSIRSSDSPFVYLSICLLFSFFAFIRNPLYAITFFAATFHFMFCFLQVMGTPVSYPPTPPNFPVFSLTIRAENKIKVIDGTPLIVNVIRQNLFTHYGHIKKETIGNDGETCFKLADRPFQANGEFKLTVKTKYFFTQLITELYIHGWQLCLTSELSRSFDYSTLFFRQCPPPFRSFSICCLSLSSMDKFQLINAPKHLHDSLVKCVGNLIQSKETHRSCFEVKMSGTPWDCSTFFEAASTRSMLLKIFQNFRQQGFAYLGTVNLKGTADSIFFINDGSTLSHEEYCTISLHGKDRLRLTDCPGSLIDMVAQTVMDKWPGGLQERSQHSGCVEFKMYGYPWFYCATTEAVNSRIFITALFQESVKNGWNLVTALNISRKASDKVVFVLRKCIPMTVPHFCIAPSGRTKIKIIGADRETELIIVDVIKKSWTPGILRDSNMLFPQYRELKLLGCPWESVVLSQSFSRGRLMMNRILAELNKHGWTVICSADVSAKFTVSPESRVSMNYNENNPCDAHSWFLAKVSVVNNQENASAPPSSVGSGDSPPSYNEAVKL
ncbi:hypothetical protein QR680_008687 [Steinernema hermaphroditum]|uniref:Uncharacterized protein n=1 Tax=Steinernema hermaphroditum TaxID=289476 RepID=A0AA39IJZ2_9BILA|nr:hypothetical protein QR680_008687 [Steinernema hermaphroditum]